jgi:hypothetical protein
MRIGKEIEVVAINHQSRFIGIILHLDHHPSEFSTPDVKDKIARYFRFTCDYLRAEAFLPKDITEWKVNVTGVSTKKC